MKKPDKWNKKAWRFCNRLSLCASRNNPICMEMAAAFRRVAKVEYKRGWKDSCVDFTGGKR